MGGKSTEETKKQYEDLDDSLAERYKKVMEAFYHLEQGNPFEFYINNFKRFEMAWKTKEYDQILSFVFNSDDVEVLKILMEM